MPCRVIVCMVEGEDRGRFGDPEAVSNTHTCRFRIYHPVRQNARSQSVLVVADTSDDFQTHHGSCTRTRPPVQSLT